jgi:hypothetical protein
VLRALDDESLVLEELSKRFTNVLVVFDDQDALPTHAGAQYR